LDLPDHPDPQDLKDPRENPVIRVCQETKVSMDPPVTTDHVVSRERTETTETPDHGEKQAQVDHQENKVLPGKLVSQVSKVLSDSRESEEPKDQSVTQEMRENPERRDTLVRREAVVTRDLLDHKEKLDQMGHLDLLELWDDVDPMDHKDQSVTTVKMVCKEESESEEPKD